MLRYLSSPFKWFIKLEAASGLVLLLSAIIALVISNSNLSELYFETLESYIFLGLNNFVRNYPFYIDVRCFDGNIFSL